MLARQPNPRRQSDSADSSYPPPTRTTTTNLSNIYSTNFSTLAITSSTPTNTQHDLVQIALRPVDASSSLPGPPHNSEYYYMPGVFSENPPIRVYDSTPDSESVHFLGENQLYDSNFNYQSSWGIVDDNNKVLADSRSPLSLHPSLQQHLHQSVHKRNSSASTIASAGPSSPYTPASSSPRIIDSDSIYCPSPRIDPFENGQHPSYHFQRHATKPSQLNFQHHIYAPAYQNYTSFTPHDESLQRASHMTMTQAPMTQQSSDTGEPARLLSMRSNGGDDSEENTKVMKESRSIIPKFDRTMSDIYQDELYNPDAPTSAPSSQIRSNQSTLLSPYKGVFSERLQAANDMRSSSPSQAISRKNSPFRQGSESVAQQHLNGDQSTTRLGSVAQMREQQKAEADAIALARHQKPKASELDAPSTISPKEAMLDFQDPDVEPEQQFASTKGPAMPSGNQGVESGSSSFKQTRSKRRSPDDNLFKGQHRTTSVRRQSSSEFSVTSPAPSRSAFAPAPTQIPQQYPFIPQLPTQSSNMTAISSRDPEFPAPLISMDSTKSDTTSRSQSGRYESGFDVQQRPLHTTADTGTYTCTFNGCSMRVATAQRLQKHKRESHRQSTPRSASTTTNGGHSPQEKPQLNSVNGTLSAINRNSQAGPHQCRQINPTTGKPCNSVFSRPYDLTRHEDTIHNARKQKVRCNLCTEEKTFSRNDALTRHMRVVHPEVDFPGKHRRRGGK